MSQTTFFSQYVLSLAIWVPILAGVVVLFLGGDQKPNATRWFALGGALLAFIVTLPLYTQFDYAQGAFQFQELARWIPAFNVNYHLGVDGMARSSA